MGWKDAPPVTKNKAAWQSAPEVDGKKYTLPESLGNAAKNFFPGVGNMLVETGKSIIHPWDTIDALGTLGAGEVNKILPESLRQASNKFDVALLGPERAKKFQSEAEQIANVVNKDFAEYGSYEGFKRKLAEHPETVLADLSTILGGAGLATKGTRLGKALATAEKYTNPLKPAEIVGGAAVKGLGMAGNKLKSIPSKLLAFESGKNPEAFNTIYQAYKNDSPELIQAINEATPLGKILYKDAIYNYGRAYNLPHDVAILAEDQTRGTNLRGLGVHDLIDKQYELYPNAANAAAARAQSAASVYRPFEQLSDAEKLKQATQAGVDTSVWTPIPPKTGKNDLSNIAYGLTKKAILPSIFHAAIPLSSPRMARVAAAAAGKGARLAGKAGEKISELPITVDQANKLGLLLYQMQNANQEEQ